MSDSEASRATDADSSVSLEADLDGTYLVDPLEVEGGSLVTVASFSYNYRVSPDIMPVTRDKHLKNFRRLQLLWEDQYDGITANDIMEFQFQPTIAELTDVLHELREIQVFFEDAPGDDFPQASTDTLAKLRADSRALKNAIQQKGIGMTAANPGGGENAVAIETAKKTYAAMEPTLRSTSETLKEDLKDLRETKPTTTAAFKKVEARYNLLDEDLNTTIKQWQNLKLEAVTAKDPAAASHCINWVKELEAVKTLTTGNMRTTTRRMGFLPGQTSFNSTVANLSAPKFSGNFDDKIDFFTFEDSLEEYFDTIGSYNPSMKLLKLKTDCLVEPALHAIRDCLHYDSAMTELRRLFGQPRVLFTGRVNEIKKLGKCPDAPVQTRVWAIEMASLLKNLISLAETYGIESMFDGSNLVKTVEDNLKPRDLYKFRDKLMELSRSDNDFDLESRAKRAKYLKEYMETIIDTATFDIDFQMTRSYRDCENVMNGRSQEAKQPEKSKPSSRKNFFNVAASSEDESEEESVPAPKPTRRKVYMNKSPHPKAVKCKLCKEDHTHIPYCETFQETKMRERWRLICISRSCPRCLRTDAAFRFEATNESVREAWYNEHKLYCTDQFLCNVGKCKDRPPHMKNNIILCIAHREENEDVMLEYVSTLNKKMIPDGLRFFFNRDFVFSAQEPPPDNVTLPDQLDGDTIIIEPDIHEPAMYMLQTLKSTNGASMLMFYDSGCYGAAMSDRAFSLLNTRTVRPGPTKLEVASGRIVDIEHGDEQFALELDTDSGQRKFAAITALRMDRVSNKFPTWPLAEAWEQLNSAYTAEGGTDKLPTADEQVGGSEVDILIGMKYFKYFPKLLFYLPSGLSVFKAVFKSASKNQAILGGTSNLWKQAAESAHSLGPSAFFLSEMRAYRHHCNTLMDASSVLHKPATSCEETDEVLFEVDEFEFTTAMSMSQGKIKEMLTAEDFGTSIEYRCPGCRSCVKCKNSEFLDKVSLQEEREQFLIEKSVYFDEQLGQVMAKLPFIVDPVNNLSDNFGTAKKVLQSQMRIAAKRADGPALIIRSHNKLRDKGYVQRIDQLPAAERELAQLSGYYIPWRTVESGSLSTPLRMVFDASSKTSSGFSLNCTLAKGTNMLADMFSLLIKFRIGPYAFSADISMAYNCVALHPDFLRYHKYLWVEDLDPDGEIVEMVVRTLIYGVKSAGNQTMVAFKATAEQAEKVLELKDSGGPACLKDSSYMDDVFTSFLRALERSRTITGLEQTLSIGKMSVKDFSLSGQPPTEKVSSDGVHVSIVGYLWNCVEDTLALDIKPLYFGKKVRGRMPPLVEGDVKEALATKFTRREMCGKVAGVYDPLGLVTPITAKLKLDLREIVKLQGDWDDPIEERFLDSWVDNLQLIQQLGEFKIKRCLLPLESQATEWEMIVTTDASQVISAAAVYVCATVNGKRICLLAAAKSKLVSKMTIPRAELRACALGATLGETVERAYGGLIEKKLYVTDSTVALSWINTDDRPLQVGVRNAVIQICRFTSPSDWRHVPTDQNPADLATRGNLTVKDIGPESIWQKGPPWMLLDEGQRPLAYFEDLTLSKEEKVAVSAEVRASDVNGIVLSHMVSTITERYQYTRYFLDPCATPWPKYTRKLAVLIRVCLIWRKKCGKFNSVQGKTDVQVGEDDISRALKMIFTWTTKETQHFNKKEALKDCIMDDGVLRYTGRMLDVCELSTPTNIFLDVDPLIFNVPVVDRYSPVAYSIMIHAHVTLTHHGGAVSTLRAAMSIAHIIRGKDLAIEVRKDCAFCKRYKAQTLEAEMGKVHENQLCVAPAFYNVQVDLFGPISSICKHFARREIKAYGVVFKCTTTLAIACYIMDSYDTTSFLDAFHRFCCSYGVPFKVFIDSGTQLLNAFNNFDFSYTDVTKSLNGKSGVRIEYGVCPVADHSSHGIVERSIKEIKKLFDVMFRGLKLDLLKLETAMMWICNELNSLPMCLGNRYTDLENLDLITPARLLFGRNNKRAPGQLPQGPRPTRLARQVVEIEEAWWQIWVKQKVADLVPKSNKWRSGQPSVKIGDIVVFVKDRNELGGLTWRLGRICDLETGRDDVTRRVTIEYKIDGETSFRSTRRSVRDVAVLSQEDDLDLAGVLSEAQRQANINFVMRQE